MVKLSPRMMVFWSELKNRKEQRRRSSKKKETDRGKEERGHNIKGSHNRRGGQDKGSNKLRMPVTVKLMRAEDTETEIGRGIDSSTIKIECFPLVSDEEELEEDK